MDFIQCTCITDYLDKEYWDEAIKAKKGKALHNVAGWGEVKRAFMSINDHPREPTLGECGVWPEEIDTHHTAPGMMKNKSLTISAVSACFEICVWDRLDKSSIMDIRGIK